MGKKGRSKNKRRSERPGSNPRVSSPGSGAPILDFDPEASRARVERALASAGANPQLVGFEAVGIQEFITANGRPVAMEGACRLIKQFDAGNLDGPCSSGSVFAGGGRGLKLVPGDQLEEVVEQLQTRFRELTWGGQLAIAHVPFDVGAQAESLRWLRMRLDGAKDRAHPPTVPLPASASQICGDCRVRARATEYPGPEGPQPACRRCAAVVRAGRDSGAERWTFEEISNGGPIAVVSADGNNLGALFAGLRGLEEQALCSDLVKTIFESAHAAACPRGKPFVAPVVGGDDVRVFLPPEELLGYVTTLANTVHDLSARLRGSGLPHTIREALKKLGVGVGAVVAPYHYPVHRLIDMAHDFEDAAKRACQEHGYRSAFDFVWLRSGEELSEGLGALASADRSFGALELGKQDFEGYLARARAIRAVPTSQRGMIVGARMDLDEDEFMNLFCYQIARSQPWQSWFDACDVEWHNRAEVAANLPDRRLLDLAVLTGGRS